MLSCSFSTSYSLRIYVHVDNELTANLSTRQTLPGRPKEALQGQPESFPQGL